MTDSGAYGHKPYPYEETLEFQEELNEGGSQAARRRLESLEEIELPMAEAEEPDGAAEEWLFDSRRPYLTQLTYYGEHKYRT